MIRRHGRCPPPCLCSPATNIQLQETDLPGYAHPQNNTDINFTLTRDTVTIREQAWWRRCRAPPNHITARVLVPTLASRWRPVVWQPQGDRFLLFSLVISPVLTPDFPDPRSRLWSQTQSPRAPPPAVTHCVQSEHVLYVSRHVFSRFRSSSTYVQCVRAEQSPVGAIDGALRFPTKTQKELIQSILHCYCVHAQPRSLRP